MSKIYKTTFQLKRGLKENWESKNPILEYGEPGFSVDDGILKIGDGLTTWKNLKPINTKAENSLPTPTQEDAGKFLRVDENGKIVLETVKNAEEVLW